MRTGVADPVDTIPDLVRDMCHNDARVRSAADRALVAVLLGHRWSPEVALDALFHALEWCGGRIQLSLIS